ncbi:MAG: NYN domain-containing protein [Rhodobacteraceae bacterium]|nr:NYN domain-containing protein [Paracoccaceae bacterium]
MDLSPQRCPVAALVDGDNIAPTHADAVLKQAGSLGNPLIRRVYGKAEAIAAWSDHGYRLCPTRPGKNAADMLLCVEAMKLALHDGIETLLIASSDQDFTYLAEHLRELGKSIIGMGEAKPPTSFRRACGKFFLLAAPQPTPKPACPNPSPLERLVAEEIRRAGAENGLPITKLSAHMHKTHNVRIGDQPEKTWRAFFAKRPDTFDIDPKGPSAMVRVKRAQLFAP